VLQELPVDEEWLDETLAAALNRIVENLEEGEKISAPDFSRLIQFREEEYNSEKTASETEWRDILTSDPAS